ncbi:hypothetical protein EGQ24_03820 [bacterium]|nr:hypothetical protein [bacterium]
MQISHISNQQTTFGKLLSGDSLKEALGPERQDLINKYNVIKLFIRHENLHKMSFADIILNYSNADGFYGVIKKKNCKVSASAEDFYCKVNTSEKALNSFKAWASNWNQRFSK